MSLLSVRWVKYMYVLLYSLYVMLRIMCQKHIDGQYDCVAN